MYIINPITAGNILFQNEFIRSVFALSGCNRNYTDKAELRKTWFMNEAKLHIKSEFLRREANYEALALSTQNVS